jgi:predicted Rossmann fold flavoprotein
LTKKSDIAVFRNPAIDVWTRGNNRMKPVIGIIGGGAAGLFAALHAARHGASVLLWESNAALGRKLAVTGSGRGNLSNSGISSDRYTCDAPQSLNTLLQNMTHDWLRRELVRCGILTYCSEDGWCFPVSNSAAAVANILTVAVQKHNITVFSQCRILQVKRESAGFELYDEQGRSHHVHRLIVATGGKAYPQLGASDGALQLLAGLGIKTLPMRPALAPLLAEVRALHKLQGVRLDVAAELYEQNKLLGRSQGNLLFTQYGFNGPAAMDLSHHASLPRPVPTSLKLNFLPYSLDEFKALWQEKKIQGWPLQALLESVLPTKLVNILVSQANVSGNRDLATLTEEQTIHLENLITDYRVAITGVKDFNFCQLAAGGVALSEIDPAGMECKKIRGLFLAGEILDVVGPCGGFNLHFAFASGALAGIGASQATDISSATIKKSDSEEPFNF